MQTVTYLNICTFIDYQYVALSRLCAIIFVFAGIILNYMLDSISQFLPKRLANGMYHWFIGVIFSATVYR